MLYTSSGVFVGETDPIRNWRAKENTTFILPLNKDRLGTTKDGSTVRYIQNLRTTYLAPSTVPYQRTVLQFNF